jgi:hypothetical protein
MARIAGEEEEKQIMRMVTEASLYLSEILGVLFEYLHTTSSRCISLLHD